jgi:tetratricopeptide (TPR) repeat protein
MQTVLHVTLAFALAATASAQTPAATTAKPTAPKKPTAPATKPAPAAAPAPRFNGMGKVDHKVSTKNPEAQAYFNQGLALIYAFNHDEAARAFQQAAKLDPNLAMAHWGVAFTYGANYNLPSMPEREKLAAEAMDKAKALAPKATPNEQAYIQALSARYSDDPKADLKKLAEQYADAMRQLSKQYPDDLDAATLFAESLMNLRPWQLWNVDGTPAPGTNEIVETLESVIARDPNHTGANHYYIHAVEASPDASRALASANRLGALAPEAGHLVHMPSHIYTRTGDQEAAARVNIAAAAADEAYMKKAGVDSGIYPMMYYSHNIHFESHARSMEGRYLEAKRAADKLYRHVSPHIKMMPMLEGFAAIPLAVEERFQQWDAILKTPKPPADQPYYTAMWHYSRGLAFAAKGDFTQAKAEQAQLSAITAKVPADQKFVQNPLRTILEIAEDLLAARIARDQKDFSTAENRLKDAVYKQDHLIYIEPPEWFFPVRESLGGLYLAAGKPAEAEQTFRADLKRNPRNGRSLFGLYESLKAQNKNEDAALVEKQLKEVWKRADTKLVAANL